MRTVPQPCGWFSLGGLASKRNSHPLTQRVCVPVPSLHGVTRFSATMSRSDSQTKPPQGYAFPSGVGPPHKKSGTTPPLPGSSTDLPPCAAPNHPGEPGGCSHPLLHHRRQASSRMGDWPLSLRVTRPNRVRLRYGSRVRLRQASPGAPYVPHYGMYAALRDCCDRIHARKRHVCATRGAQSRNHLQHFCFGGLIGSQLFHSSQYSVNPVHKDCRVDA
jgi:hypothetical protein